MPDLRREEGFTLVEVLVAMIIFLIIVLAMTSFLGGSYLSLTRAGNKAATVFEAQSELEKALDDPDYNEAEEIERVPGYEVEIFNRRISGTKITVKEIYDEEQNREVNYVAFKPD